MLLFFTSRDKETKEKKPFVNDRFQRLQFVMNPMVIRGALAMVCLNIGANIAFGNINSDIAGRDVNVDTLAMISSLADMASSFFGGGPVEVVISATASAPHPVWSGVVMMAIMAVILLLKLLPKIGKYIPTASIAGFFVRIRCYCDTSWKRSGSINCWRGITKYRWGNYDGCHRYN